MPYGSLFLKAAASSRKPASKICTKLRQLAAATYMLQRPYPSHARQPRRVCLDINPIVTRDCQITLKVPVLRRRPARTPPQRVLKAPQACAGAAPVSEHSPAVLLKHSWQQPIQTLPQKDLHSFRVDSRSPFTDLVHWSISRWQLLTAGPTVLDRNYLSVCSLIAAAWTVRHGTSQSVCV